MPQVKRKADASSEQFLATAYAPYCVNEEGIVINSKTGAILSQRDHCGYRLVTLRIAGESKPCLVHLLVIRAFHGPPPPRHSCDHIDRNRSNNHISNLRWATSQEQRQNSSAHRRPGGQRAVTLTDLNGNVTHFASVVTAMTVVAPDRHATSSGVYKALAKGHPIHGHTWKYATFSATNIVPIPSAFVGGTRGYSVSEEGYVKTPTGRLSRGTLRLTGYVSISIDQKEYRVHRLVAAAHLPKPDGADTVNHIDGNKQNNHATNLEWTTAAGNSQHSFAHGLSKVSSGRKVKRQTLSNGRQEVFASVREAAEATGDVRRSCNITACCKGRQKSAYGFIWQYV